MTDADPQDDPPDEVPVIPIGSGNGSASDETAAESLAPDAAPSLEDKVDVLLSLVTEQRESARSAEMFEGLRRQVISARQARNNHLVDLAQLASALDHGAEASDLKLLLRDLLLRADLEVIDDYDETVARHFDEVDGTDEPDARVTDPAYVDGETGRTIRLGRRGRGRRRTDQ